MRGHDISTFLSSRGVCVCMWMGKGEGRGVASVFTALVGVTTAC